MMVSEEQGLTARFVIKRFARPIVVVASLLLCFGCAKHTNEPVFETILDTYISYNGLTGKEHYLIASTDEETVKDRCMLAVEYRHIAVDELLLPEFYLEGEYRGVTLYCLAANPRMDFPIDNRLGLKRVRNTDYTTEWRAANEYFNEIFVEYDKKDRKILYVATNLLPDTAINYFERAFRNEGIME